MNDISEIERRILYALERIGRGIDMLDGEAVSADPSPAGHADLVAELHAELDAERSANAQLTERVRAIKDRQETMVAALEKKVARLTQQIDATDASLERQRRLNGDLLAANQALTDAAGGNVVQPELLNRAMMTELAAMRAARASEMIEMEEIMSELKPLIGEVA